MASTSGPRSIQISSPVSRSTATAAKRTGRSSIRTSPTASRRKRAQRSVPTRAFPFGSSRMNIRHPIRRASASIASGESPAANNPPTIPPALVPVTISGRQPASISTRSTRICANPRAPPPLNAIPSRCGRRMPQRIRAFFGITGPHPPVALEGRGRPGGAPKTLCPSPHRPGEEKSSFSRSSLTS